MPSDKIWCLSVETGWCQVNDPFSDLPALTAEKLYEARRKMGWHLVEAIGVNDNPEDQLTKWGNEYGMTFIEVDDGTTFTQFLSADAPSTMEIWSKLAQTRLQAGIFDKLSDLVEKLGR